MELIFHASVRSIRKSHGNAILGLLINIAQTLTLVAVFFVVFSFLGLRGSGVRGDFLLYLLTGVFLFMSHVKALNAVVQSEGPTSPMMKHATMNTVISIAAGAMSSLYIQLLSMGIILFGAHVIIAPVVIDKPVGMLAQVILAWFSGVAVGLVFLALKPWFPGFVTVAALIYSRANMFASGKMFVANNLPAHLLPYFAWNPLFHTIDQSRGAAFINYTPHYTSPTYALTVSVVLVMIGLLGEFYTRRHASLSWEAKR